jgi:hypothetical protein
MILGHLQKGCVVVRLNFEGSMAHFQKAPISLLTHTPVDIVAGIRAVLAKPGTYNIYKNADYRLKVPIGNSTWKGDQAKLIGVWGGDEDGNRLEVTADPPIVDVTLVSEHKVGKHLWAWLVQAKPNGTTGVTFLHAKTAVASSAGPAGRDYANPLAVTVMDEVANAGPTGNFGGGNRAETVAAIREECQRQGVTLKNQIAYILGTSEWESGFTVVRERFTVAHEPQRRGLTYYPYYGRGFVQLTLEGNYKHYSTLLGVDLVGDPDLALQPDIALYVLVHGMMHGSFGIALPTFVNATQTDFLHARQSVNVMDRATEIAALANGWLRRL